MTMMAMKQKLRAKRKEKIGVIANIMKAVLVSSTQNIQKIQMNLNLMKYHLLNSLKNSMAQKIKYWRMRF